MSDAPEDAAARLIADFEAAWPRLAHEHRVALFDATIKHFAAYIRDNGAYSMDVFGLAEAHGVHVLPTHYYSPIPVVSELDPDRDLTRILPPDFDVRRAEDNAFFDDVVLPYARELTGIPVETAPQGELYWENGMFNVMDCAAYYGMVRLYRPKRIIEVGSGFSTLVATRAARRNGDTVITCIEPFPTEYFSKHLIGLESINLVVEKVQDASLETFAALGENDILFIDSSHVAKPGSDVEHLFFKVLPALRPGVLVHLHDIYLPYGYPRLNARQLRFWNENYLLAAFLHGNANWRIVLSNCLVSLDFANRQKLCAAIEPGDAAKAKRMQTQAAGGSFWMRRI